MRTLLSWISIATCNLFTQVLTFVFSGIGCGYAMTMLYMYRLKGLESASSNNGDWLGLRDALIAGDVMTALTQVPVVGWYFVVGFVVGGFFSIFIINFLTIRLRRLAPGGQAMAEKLVALPQEAAVPAATPSVPVVVQNVLADLDPNTVAWFEDPEAILLTVPALLLFDHRSLTESLADGKLVQPVQTLQTYLDTTTEAERFALMELTLEHVRKSKDPAIKATLELIRDVAPGNAWGLQCWVSMFLQAISGQTTAVKVKYQNFDQSVRPLLEVISIGAVVGGNGSAELRFQRVWGHTGLEPLSVMNVDAFDFADLDQSVESLRIVPQSLRAELANAFAKALMERNVMGRQEATFVRYLSQRWEVATQWKVAPGFKA